MQGFLNYIAVHSIVCAQRFPVEKNEASNTGFCHPCAVWTLPVEDAEFRDPADFSHFETFAVCQHLATGCVDVWFWVTQPARRVQQFLIHVVPLIFVLCSWTPQLSRKCGKVGWQCLSSVPFLSIPWTLTARCLLYVRRILNSAILHSALIVSFCVWYGSQNKQRSFRKTALTNWISCTTEESVYCAVRNASLNVIQLNSLKGYAQFHLNSFWQKPIRKTRSYQLVTEIMRAWKQLIK
jgi:hypothetical protein